MFMKTKVSLMLDETTYNRHCNHAFWSLSIESRFKHFVAVEKCKQDSEDLTYSSFAGMVQMHGYGVYCM